MKRILVCGTIRKYTNAGEQKAIINVIAPDKDKASQEEAQARFEALIKDLTKTFRGKGGA